MNFKTYERYKDSNEEWIGIVPDTWVVKPIREFYDYRSEKVSDKVYKPLSVTKQGILPQLEHAAKTDNNDSRKKVKKRDFVINSRSDRKGSCGVSPYNGSVSLIYHVLSSKDSTIDKYAHHLFRSVMFAEEFYKWGHGIVDDLWSTRWDEMKKIKIPMPPKEERLQIGHYLDKKTNNIDEQIKLNEKLIQLLEEKRVALINQVVTKGLNPDVAMKDSGIEWIGEIPEHWDVAPLNRYANVTKLAGFEFTEHIQYIPNGEIIALRALNIRNNKLNLENIVRISKKVSNKLPRSKLYKNDLIFTYVGAKTGAIALIDKDNTYHLAPNIAKITNISKDKLHTKFLLYTIASHHEQEEIWFKISKSGQEAISMEKIRTLTLLIPPIKEQISITNYLNDKISKLDETITKIKENITLLEEYKTSLIHHVVTGKIDVRGEKI